MRTSSNGQNCDDREARLTDPFGEHPHLFVVTREAVEDEDPRVVLRKFRRNFLLNDVHQSCAVDQALFRKLSGNEWIERPVGTKLSQMVPYREMVGLRMGENLRILDKLAAHGAFAGCRAAWI